MGTGMGDVGNKGNLKALLPYFLALAIIFVRMYFESEFSNDKVRRRFKFYYGKVGKRNLAERQIPYLRNKWASFSEYAGDIKQTFLRYYNKLHNRRGFFWADRFKSILIDNGDTFGILVLLQISDFINTVSININRSNSYCIFVYRRQHVIGQCCPCSAMVIGTE
jgi:hypothetical protein